MFFKLSDTPVVCSEHRNIETTVICRVTFFFPGKHLHVIISPINCVIVRVCACLREMVHRVFVRARNEIVFVDVYWCCLVMRLLLTNINDTDLHVICIVRYVLFTRENHAVREHGLRETLCVFDWFDRLVML